MLRKGQEVLVQVSKESLGTKGARITSFISIPGRYIVYMPQAAMSASRAASTTRRSASGCAASSRALPPAHGGFIVRTVAEGKGDDELIADIQFLTRLWARSRAASRRARRRRSCTRRWT